MNSYKVKVARFAETIRIGESGDEIRYVNVDEVKFRHFKMTYHDSMLWIYDTKKNIMYTTSTANLRMLIMESYPAEFSQVPKAKPEPKPENK